MPRGATSADEHARRIQNAWEAACNAVHFDKRFCSRHITVGDTHSWRSFFIPCGSESIVRKATTHTVFEYLQLSGVPRDVGRLSNTWPYVSGAAIDRLGLSASMPPDRIALSSTPQAAP